MSQDVTLGRWPDNPPKGRDLIVQIRLIAQTSGNVAFSVHAAEQLLARNYTDRDVLRGFKIGDVVGDVTAGNRVGEWVCEVIFPGLEERGSRDIGVITIVQNGVRLRIKTVMWKDQR